MKDFEDIKEIRPDIESVSRFQKEYTLKRREPVQRGLTLFQINMNNMDVAEPVKIVTTVTVVDYKTKEVTKQHRATHDPDAFYVWAMNKQNAVRKLKRDFMKFVQDSIE